MSKYDISYIPPNREMLASPLFEFGLWSLTNMTLFIDEYSFIKQTL